MGVILNDRISSFRIDREPIQTSPSGVKARMIPASDSPPDVMVGLVEKLREYVVSGENSFRMAYIRSIIDQVEIGENQQ